MTEYDSNTLFVGRDVAVQALVVRLCDGHHFLTASSSLGNSPATHSEEHEI